MELQQDTTDTPVQIINDLKIEDFVEDDPDNSNNEDDNSETTIDYQLRLSKAKTSVEEDDERFAHFRKVPDPYQDNINFGFKLKTLKAAIIAYVASLDANELVKENRYARKYDKILVGQMLIINSIVFDIHRKCNIKGCPDHSDKVLHLLALRRGYYQAGKSLEDDLDILIYRWKRDVAGRMLSAAECY